jgi:hypothetical protein
MSALSIARTISVVDFSSMSQVLLENFSTVLIIPLVYTSLHVMLDDNVVSPNFAVCLIVHVDERYTIFKSTPHRHEHKVCHAVFTFDRNDDETCALVVPHVSWRYLTERQHASPEIYG